MAIKNTFKITDLPAITKIDNEDLFLIADKDEVEATSTKNMSIRQLMDYISKSKVISDSIKDDSSEISKAIESKISKEISTGSISQQIDQKIETKIEESVFDAGNAN